MRLGNPVLNRLLETGTIPLDDGATVTLRHHELPESLSHIDRETGALLQQLIAERRPQRTLEVGLAYGVSTLFICDALQALGPRTRHLVIDPFQHGKWRGLGLRTLAQAGYADMIDFREQPSELVLRPDVLARDWDLGIGGRTAALQKTGEDTRHTYFDAEF